MGNKKHLLSIGIGIVILIVLVPIHAIFIPALISFHFSAARSSVDLMIFSEIFILIMFSGAYILRFRKYFKSLGNKGSIILHLAFISIGLFLLLLIFALLWPFFIISV